MDYVRRYIVAATIAIVNTLRVYLIKKMDTAPVDIIVMAFILALCLMLWLFTAFSMISILRQLSLGFFLSMLASILTVFLITWMEIAKNADPLLFNQNNSIVIQYSSYYNSTAYFFYEQFLQSSSNASLPLNHTGANHPSLAISLMDKINALMK